MKSDTSLLAHGYCLIFGTSTAILSMILHPNGGSVTYIKQIKNLLMFTHGIAILAIPFIVFGIFGISKRLSTKTHLSELALIFSFFGLISVALAGIINGIVLPDFAAQSEVYNAATTEQIIKYGLSLSRAFALIFLTFIFIGILLWSSLMIVLKEKIWYVGYWGIIITLLGLSALVLQINFTQVFIFGVFTAGIFSWVLLTGLWLITRK